MGRFRHPTPEAAVPPAPAPAQVADRWLDVHTRFAPLLWLLGILHASAALMMLTSALRRWPRDFAINLLVGLWLATGVFQSLAAVLNGALQANLGLGLRNALSFTAIGWVFAGLGLATGAGSSLAGQDAARLYSRLGVYTLVLGALTLLAAGAGVMLPSIETPVSMLSGSGTSFRAGPSEAVHQLSGVQFFHNEVTLGTNRLRLVLMYPWAPALGIGSLGLILISSRCAQWGWRLAGMGGGLLGVIFSWSRLAAVAGIIVLAFLMFLRAPAWLRVAAALCGAAALGVSLLFGFNPFSLVDQLYSSVNTARAGSSLARDIIVDASWAGFLNSPWIGHGWIGQSAHPTENLPIGSHSTIYGTLYTGGALVFTTFALAMTTMLVLLGWRLAGETDSRRRKDIEVGMCLALILCIATRYESIYSLSLPCFFYFTWIGAAVAGGLRTEPARAFENARAREPWRERAWTPAAVTGRFARPARVKRWAAREDDGTDGATRGSAGQA